MPVNLYKKVGETSLERINRLKKENSKYADEKIGFAGRLDPTAEGVLLVLVGDENKNREGFLNMNKEYIFEVLFGFETDTYDILGIPKRFRNEKDILLTPSLEDINKGLKNFEGKFMQHFPPFSSKHIEGKSLIEWAYTKRLNEIDLPEKEVCVYDIDLISVRSYSKSDLYSYIKDRVSKVNSNFRPKQIMDEWKRILDGGEEERFGVVKIFVKSSSGTYMRTIASDIGKFLDIGGCTFSIFRTKVDKYDVADSVR